MTIIKKGIDFVRAGRIICANQEFSAYDTYGSCTVPDVFSFRIVAEAPGCRRVSACRIISQTEARKIRKYEVNNDRCGIK